MKRKPDIYEFAKQFCTIYDKLKIPAIVRDPKSGQKIRKVKIRLRTPSNVETSTGIININSTTFGKFTQQTQLLFILWAYYKNNNTDIKSYCIADTKALKCIIKHEGKIYPSTLKEFISVLQVNATNIDRCRNFTKLTTKKNVRKKRNTSRSKK